MKKTETVVRNADAVNHFGLNLAGAWKESQLFRDAATAGQAEHGNVQLKATSNMWHLCVHNCHHATFL